MERKKVGNGKFLKKKELPNFKKETEGFTLIELAIVLLIISILTAISVSLYRYYVDYKVKRYAEQIYRDIVISQSLAFKNGNSTFVVSSPHNYNVFSPEDASVPIINATVPDAFISIKVENGDKKVVFRRNFLPESNGSIVVTKNGVIYCVKFENVSGRVYLASGKECN